MFENLSNNQDAKLFNPIRDQSNPGFDLFSKCKHYLYVIEQKFKMGDQFTDTSQIAKEIRLMIQERQEFASEAANHLLGGMIYDFSREFENQIKSIENTKIMTPDEIK